MHASPQAAGGGGADSEAAAVLGSELRALVEAQGSPVAAVSALTTLPSPESPRAVFRVTLSDGRILKARILESADHVERVVGLLGNVRDRHFARILAWSGTTILEEWIPGEPFDSAPRAAAAFERAGALLDSLHSTPVLSPDGRETLLDWRNTVLKRLESLRAIGMISRRKRDALVDLVCAFAPEGGRIGLVYVDFCAENIVVSEAGELHAIDNETMAVQPLDYDLARTWYRWPMRRPEREAFAEGYGRRGSLDAFRAHFPFWATAVLVAACLSRVPHDARGASRPIRMLHKIGGHAWSGADAGRRRIVFGQNGYRSFHFAGTVIGVHADEPAHLTWLEEFLAPQFRVARCPTPHVELRMQVDARAFSQMRSTQLLPADKAFDCFMMDDGVVRLAAWAEDDDQRIAWDEEFRAFHIVDRQRPVVRVLCRPDDPAPRLALMRMARELALQHAYRRGELIVHAAALAFGNAGVVVAGPKASGKSTLLIHLLQAGATRYISNDRVVLRRPGARPWAILGVPTVIAIREQTTELFPWLRERQKACGYRHAYTVAETREFPLPPHLIERALARPSLTPRQFCNLVGTFPAAGADLSAILFPRRTDKTPDGAQNPGIALLPLTPDEAAARLRTSLFGPPNAAPGGSFLADVIPCVPARRTPLEHLRRVTSQVRCFDCLMGPEAYARHPPAELLAEIL